MKIVDKELNFLIWVLGKRIYYEPSMIRHEVANLNISRLLRLSLRNHALYYILSVLSSKEYADELSINYRILVYKIHKLIKMYYNRLIDILDWIVKTLDGTEYLIIKTYLKYPKIPNDIDIIARDSLSCCKKLLKNGAKLVHYKPNVELVLAKDKIIIHLHKRITWTGGMEIFDDNFLWKSEREVYHEGIKIPVPNYEADLLMHIGHSIFENLFIDLPTIMYIFHLERYVNIKDLLEQTKRYKWQKSFLLVVNLIDKVHSAIYSYPSPLYEIVKDMKSFNSLDIKFPLFLTKKYIIYAFIEKRIIAYPLVKIKDTIGALLSSESYRKITFKPPEAKILEEAK